MSVTSSSKGKSVASSNWLNLQKKLEADKKTSATANRQEFFHERTSRKRQKLDDSPQGSWKNSFSRLSSERSPSPSSSHIPTSVHPSATNGGGAGGPNNGELLEAMQQMALGHIEYTDAQKLPGKYLALDCEMVGVGIDGAESSLARVSMVNFYGAVIVDEFVRQKERVIDYRTQWSGIRESDMVHAKPFEEVQKRVSDLLKDKILIGHAVYNDLKALLLSHPRPQTRDTQFYAHKFGLCKTKRVALRHLVKDEVGLTIQSGEHSSITDARATMAVYRLHKKEWEKGSKPLPVASQVSKSVSSSTTSSSTIPSKRNVPDADSSSELGPEEDQESNPASKMQPPLKSKSKRKMAFEDSSTSQNPGGGRKGVSSGLTTVIRRAGKKSGTKSESRGDLKATKSEWWKQLPGGISTGSGSKGSIQIGMKK